MAVGGGDGGSATKAKAIVAGASALAVAAAGTSSTAHGELKAQNFAGYIETRSGRLVAFALMVNDAGPIGSLSDGSAVVDDEARISSLIHELL